MAAFNIWRPLSKNIINLSYKKEKTSSKKHPPFLSYSYPPTKEPGETSSSAGEGDWLGESESELTMYQGYSTFIQSMNIDTRDSRKVMEGHPHGSAQEHFRLKANLLKKTCLAGVQARRPPGQC